MLVPVEFPCHLEIAHLIEIQILDLETRPAWSTFYATEHWAALVDEDDWGLGGFHAGVVRFLGGFLDLRRLLTLDHRLEEQLSQCLDSCDLPARRGRATLQPQNHMVRKGGRACNCRWWHPRRW